MKHFAIIVSVKNDAGEDIKSTKLYLKLDQDINNREELRNIFSKLVKSNYSVAVLRTNPRLNKPWRNLQEVITKLPQIRFYKTVKTSKKIGETKENWGVLIDLPAGVEIDACWSSISPTGYYINHFISLRPANKYVRLNVEQLASYFNREWQSPVRPNLHFVAFNKSHQGVFFQTSINSHFTVDFYINDLLRINYDTVVPVYEDVVEQIEL